MSERLVVLSTVQGAEDAERIARALVERGLAACVNIVPGVTSVYRWKGAIECEPERLLVIKTRAQRFEALRQELVALHPYELPEVIALRHMRVPAAALSCITNLAAGVGSGELDHAEVEATAKTRRADLQRLLRGWILAAGEP